jgi:hypothetical protein
MIMMINYSIVAEVLAIFRMLLHFTGEGDRKAVLSVFATDIPIICDRSRTSVAREVYDS